MAVYQLNIIVLVLVLVYIDLEMILNLVFVWFDWIIRLWYRGFNDYTCSRLKYQFNFVQMSF